MRASAESSRIQRLVNVSLLASAALVLSYLESMVPLPVTLPGAKLGLGNVAVVVALFALGKRAALGVAVAKVLASGLLFGSPIMLAYSLGGTALGFLSMLILRCAGTGPVAVSMAAAIFHNAGQVIVAAALLGNASVLLTFPPLAAVACATGALTGAVAAAALAAFHSGPASTSQRRAARSSLPRLQPALAKLKGFSASHHSPAVKMSLTAARREDASRCPASAPQGIAPAKSGHNEKQAAQPSSQGGFGVFRPGTSLMHRLDPRTKILLAVGYFASVYLASSAAALALAAAAAALALALSGATWRNAKAALKPFLWLIVFIVAFDALFMESGEVLWACGAVSISAGGLAYGAEQAVRFLCALLATSMLMATTSPTALTDGFALLIAPLRHLGVHVESASLVMGLTLRFIPTFSEELARLRRAQQARFANFDRGNVVQRVLALKPLVTPLLAGAHRHSMTLATSIEARAFGAKTRRTSLQAYRMAKRDWLALAAAALLLTACIMP